MNRKSRFALAAKGLENRSELDCKSAGLRLRRFESYLPHHQESVVGDQ